MPNRVSHESQGKIRKAWQRRGELKAEGSASHDIVRQLANELGVGERTLYNWLKPNWLEDRGLRHLTSDYERDSQRENDLDWVLEPFQPLVSDCKEALRRWQTWRIGALKTLGDNKGTTVGERRAWAIKKVAKKRGMSIREVLYALDRGDKSIQGGLEEIGGRYIWT